LPGRLFFQGGSQPSVFTEFPLNAEWQSTSVYPPASNFRAEKDHLWL
jgi:hypothetical protein